VIKCSIEDCDRIATVRGWCSIHYGRWNRHGDPTILLNEKRPSVCIVEDCGRTNVISRGLCNLHRSRVLNTGEVGSAQLLYEKNSGKKCVVDGCPRIAESKQMCNTHYRRWFTMGDAGPAEIKHGRSGKLYANPNGYMYVYYPEHPNSSITGSVALHTIVMSEHLRRPLAPHESVHHKNGIKDDNRLANLELWSRSQPYGARVEDKISWAIEFLAEYGYEVSK
jgi:hypothetical protein